MGMFRDMNDAFGVLRSPELKAAGSPAARPSTR
jgi:hypothetical protein